MEKAANKANRLAQIETLLLAHPEGLHPAEIARRLGVNRSTVGRYLPDLPKHIYIDDLDGGKWKVDRTADLMNVRLNLHESLAIHLATRLLATRLDKHNPHAAAALRKLAAAMERWAPRISLHMAGSADAMDGSGRRLDPRYLQVLETLTLAWAEERKVSVWHRHEQSGQVHTYTFSPYFIEPYAVGQTTHVIGLREPPGKLRTFKIERIERIERLPDPYTIPADFDPAQALAHAWGIWYTESAPVEVALRFHPRVANRVKETCWHPSEKLEEQPDGSLVWRAQVAEPQEMLPWIRGWGADCEVLEPRRLREKLVGEARRLAEVYEIAEKKEHLIAHFRKRDNEPQYLIEHLNGVASLTGQFADKVGLREFGEILGLLHDLGKASQEFQDYIQSATGMKNPDADGFVDVESKKGKIDHSSAGSQIIYRMLSANGKEGRIAAQIAALCIASHHSGLIDCLTPNGDNNFQRRMHKPEEDTHVEEAISKLKEINEQLPSSRINKIEHEIINKLNRMKEDNDSKETLIFKYGLLIRFLFSCLIDADRLDTADFETPNNTLTRNYGSYLSWEILLQRLENKIQEFENKAEKNEVDVLRNYVSQSCLTCSTKPKGIYQLTVPTGGGKTLSSLRFALNHASHHKMDRVFYIIPYTSIIDQNAEEVRKILEERNEKGQLLDEVVLEHHSNLTPEEETRRQNLLAENWDAPIVFTTQVQFLEALFGSGTRNARRMHQLANSVIIFDEVQTLPINCIHMLNIAIRFLVHGCDSSVVLCTATQPPLNKIAQEHRALIIEPDKRIIANETELYKKLKRVEAFDKRKVGGWSDDEIAELAEKELEKNGSVLIIVNTKKSARSLYQVLSKKNITRTYHLSTNMCPAHRLNVLEEIKSKLIIGEPLICVSTQLIEAGVDIDFGSVIRFMAGLDSITQAAGRCNRHGKKIDKNGNKTLGNIWVLNPLEENIQKLTDIKIGIDIAERVLGEFNDDPSDFDHDRLSLEAMSAYYMYYFHERKVDMVYRVSKESIIGRDDNLFNLLSTNSKSVEAYHRVSDVKLEETFRQSFQSAARVFEVINSPTKGVVVHYGEEGEEIIKDLCSAFDLDKQYKLLKKAQRFSVNLFHQDFDRLAKKEIVREVQEGSGIFYLDKQHYDNQFGWSEEIVNKMEFLMN